MTSCCVLFAHWGGATRIFCIALWFFQDGIDIRLSEPFLCSNVLYHSLFLLLRPQRWNWVRSWILGVGIRCLLLTLIFHPSFLTELRRIWRDPLRCAVCNSWGTCHSLWSRSYLNQLSLFPTVHLSSALALLELLCPLHPHWAFQYISSARHAPVLVLNLNLDIILRLLLWLCLALLQQPLSTVLFLLRIVSEPLLTSFLSLQEFIDFLKRFLMSCLIVTTDVVLRTHVLSSSWIFLDSRCSSDGVKNALSCLQRNRLNVVAFLHDRQSCVVHWHWIVFAGRWPARMVSCFVSVYAVELLWDIYQMRLSVGTRQTVSFILNMPLRRPVNLLLVKPFPFLWALGSFSAFSRSSSQDVSIVHLLLKTLSEVRALILSIVLIDRLLILMSI